MNAARAARFYPKCRICPPLFEAYGEAGPIGTVPSRERHLLLSEAYLIDQNGLSHPAVLRRESQSELINTERGSMNTEKTGQQSNPQDPTQRDRDQEKQGQRDQQGYGQNDQQKDRKPGQGQQGDVDDQQKKSA